MLDKVCTRLIYLQTCYIMEAVVPYAARIISYTSPWWAVGNNLMIGEDVRRKYSKI